MTLDYHAIEQAVNAEGDASGFAKLMQAFRQLGGSTGLDEWSAHKNRELLWRATASLVGRTNSWIVAMMFRKLNFCENNKAMIGKIIAFTNKLSYLTRTKTAWVTSLSTSRATW